MTIVLLCAGALLLAYLKGRRDGAAAVRHSARAWMGKDQP